MATPAGQFRPWRLILTFIGIVAVLYGLVFFTPGIEHPQARHRSAGRHPDHPDRPHPGRLRSDPGPDAAGPDDHGEPGQRIRRRRRRGADRRRQEPGHHGARQRGPVRPDPQRPDEHPAGAPTGRQRQPGDQLPGRLRATGQPARAPPPPRPERRTGQRIGRSDRPDHDPGDRRHHPGVRARCRRDRRAAGTDTAAADHGGERQPRPVCARRSTPRSPRRRPWSTDSATTGRALRRPPNPPWPRPPTRRSPELPRPAPTRRPPRTAAAAPAWPAGSNPDNPTQPLGTDQAAWTAWQTAAITALPTLSCADLEPYRGSGRPEQAADRLRRRRHRDLPARQDADRRHPDRHRDLRARAARAPAGWST